MLNKLTKAFLLLLFLYSAQTFSRGLESLRSGDIILLSLKCRSCDYISTETDSQYNHSGIVLRDNRGQLLVAESINFVHALPVKEFLKRFSLKSAPGIFRSKELADLYDHPTSFSKFEKKLWRRFKNIYAGLPFDSQYLWDNYDKNGRELLYCSEFITKILNHFLNDKIQTTSMDFTKNYNYWNRYFDGQIPHGKQGNSPADFEKNENFFHVFNLYNYLP